VELNARPVRREFDNGNFGGATLRPSGFFGLRAGDHFASPEHHARRPVSGDEFDPGGFEHAPNRLKIVPSSDASADFKIGTTAAVASAV
jgi:hypothetical protein